MNDMNDGVSSPGKNNSKRWSIFTLRLSPTQLTGALAFLEEKQDEETHKPEAATSKEKTTKTSDPPGQRKTLRVNTRTEQTKAQQSSNRNWPIEKGKRRVRHGSPTEIHQLRLMKTAISRHLSQGCLRTVPMVDANEPGAKRSPLGGVSGDDHV